MKHSQSIESSALKNNSSKKRGGQNSIVACQKLFRIFSLHFSTHQKYQVTILFNKNCGIVEIQQFPSIFFGSKVRIEMQDSTNQTFFGSSLLFDYLES